MKRLLFALLILSGTAQLPAQSCGPNSAVFCAAITQQENLLCWGRPTGVLGAAGYGIAGPADLQYLWSNGATTATISQLSAGTYTVTVTDAVSGQTATAAATLTQPPSPISLDIININPVTCTAAGSATVISWGGTGGHTYLWSQGATTATAYMTIEGHYSLTVTDANGCTQKGMVNMPGAGTYETFELPVICAGESHTRGGQSFTQQGLYTVAVPAPNDCDTLVHFYLTVLDPTPPLAGLPDSIVLNCSDPIASICAGPLLESGAIAWWKDDIAYSTEACINISAEGQYRFSSALISENKTCTAEKEVVVTEHFFTNMNVQSISEYFPVCTSDSIRITYWVHSDAPLQEVVWLAGVDTLAVADTLVLKVDISEGIVTPIYASATDIYGCQRSGLQGIAVIIQPFPLMIFSLSEPRWNCTGWTEYLFNYGGQAPYSWQWSNGATGATQSLPPSGIYEVTLTDALGCTDMAVVATDPAPTLLMEGTPAWSATLHNGTASAVELIGADHSLASWLWSTGAVTAQISGLAPGEYCVTATDYQGCTYTGCYTVEQVTGATQPMVENSSLLWYPNPVQAGDMLCLTTPTTTSLQWQIVNQWGSTVLSGMLPAGDDCVSLPENMPEGVFQFITQNRHFFQCNKIFLQKRRY